MTNPPARERRTLWLRPLLTAARLEGPLPRYGDDTWLVMPDHQLRKYVAAMLAGEHYVRQEEDLPVTLENELAAQMWLDEIEAAVGHHEAFLIVQRLARVGPYRERGIPRRAA